MSKNWNVVGLVPAAGYARRVFPLLSCSKEIYPISHPDFDSTVVSSYLMDSFKKAGVRQTYWVLRNGKWDIPEYYNDGSSIGLDLAYIVVEATDGVPQTIDMAYPFIKDNLVLFGFPDILFNLSNAFVALLEKQQTSGSDLVLGLFKTANPSKADMVVFDSKGNLNDIVIKPEQTSLTYTWIIAVWTPVFSSFLHEYLAKRKDEISVQESSELYIGDVVREAIHSGIKTTYVKFEKGSFLDIGTPSDLGKVNNLNWIKKSKSDN